MTTLKTMPKFLDCAARVMSEHSHRQDFKAKIGSIRISENTIKVTDDNDVKHDLVLTRDGFKSLFQGRIGFPVKSILSEMIMPGTRDCIISDLIRSHRHDDVYMRCGGGGVEAILGGDYTRLDNFDICRQLIVMQDDGEIPADIRAESFYLSVDARSMHMRLVAPEWQFSIGDDPYYGAVVIQNNELGRGTFEISSAIQRRACENMAIGQHLVDVTHRWKQEEEFIDALRNGMMGVLGAVGEMRDYMAEMHNVPVKYPIEMLERLLSDLKMPKRAHDDAIDYLAEQTRQESMYDIVQAITFGTQNVSVQKGRAIPNWVRRTSIERNAWDVAKSIRSAHSEGVPPEDFYMDPSLKIMDKIAQYLSDKSSQYEGEAQTALMDSASEILTIEVE